VKVGWDETADLIFTTSHGVQNIQVASDFQLIKREAETSFESTDSSSACAYGIDRVVETPSQSRQHTQHSTAARSHWWIGRTSDQRWWSLATQVARRAVAEWVSVRRRSAIARRKSIVQYASPTPTDHPQCTAPHNAAARLASVWRPQRCCSAGGLVIAESRGFRDKTLLGPTSWSSAQDFAKNRS